MKNLQFFLKNNTTPYNQKKRLKNLFIYLLFIVHFDYGQNTYFNNKLNFTLVHNPSILISNKSKSAIFKSSISDSSFINVSSNNLENNLPPLVLNTSMKFNPEAYRQNELNYFWLNLIGENEQFCQMALGYRAEATNCVDDYDSTRIDGEFTLNSLICTDTNDYVIQSRAMPFNPSDSVPLSIKIATSGNCTIFLDHTLGLFTNSTQPIYLHDLFTNTYSNLRLGSYSFYSRFGIFNNRFEIIYNSTLSTANYSYNNVSLMVYKYNDSIVVNSGSEIISNVKVFNMLGKLLIDINNSNDYEVRLNIGDVNEIVLVKTTLFNGQIITKKVFN